MDFTTFTFFVTNMALLAAGLFLWLERDNVNPKWKTALTVSGMVCFIAAVHYYYMRGNLDATDVVSIRYIDWLITVPLQMVEFYIVLAAVTAVSVGVFHRLLGFSVLMLVFGYLGETATEGALITNQIGWGLGMVFWGLMLREIWSGEAAEVNAKGNAAGQYAFDGMKKIVTFGWAIYPIGYALGYFAGVDNPDLVNQVYNLADFVNKILIGMIVYAAAKMDTK